MTRHAPLFPLLPLFAVATLSACAVPKPGSPEWTAQVEQRKLEAREDAVKSSVDDAPSWFLAPPEDDSVSIYSAGTAVSDDLQFALDKAVLGAKRNIADRVNSRLSAKMKEFYAETGVAENAQVAADSERTTINLITEANLSGYVIKERKLQPAGSQYRAYVLLRYPLGNANRLLLDQIHKNQALESRLQASRAYQDLEKDIEAARQRGQAEKAEPAAPSPAPQPEVRQEPNAVQKL